MNTDIEKGLKWYRDIIMKTRKMKGGGGDDINIALSQLSFNRPNLLSSQVTFQDLPRDILTCLVKQNPRLGALSKMHADIRRQQVEKNIPLHTILYNFISHKAFKKNGNYIIQIGNAFRVVVERDEAKNVIVKFGLGSLEDLADPNAFPDDSTDYTILYRQLYKAFAKGEHTQDYGDDSTIDYNYTFRNGSFKIQTITNEFNIQQQYVIGLFIDFILPREKMLKKDNEEAKHLKEFLDHLVENTVEPTVTITKIDGKKGFKNLNIQLSRIIHKFATMSEKSNLSHTRDLSPQIQQPLNQPPRQSIQPLPTLTCQRILNDQGSEALVNAIISHYRPIVPVTIVNEMLQTQPQPPALSDMIFQNAILWENDDEDDDFVGGATKKQESELVFVLGRKRKVIKDGRKSVVSYKGVLITLKEARVMEKRLATLAKKMPPAK